MYDRHVEYLASTGAYESTRPDKRPFINFPQWIIGPNSRVTKLELDTLRNQNRFLCMTGIGSAYVNRLTNHVIGNGIGFRASIDQEKLKKNDDQAKKINAELTRLWKTFWMGENGNYERMYNGGYFQGLIFNSMLQGGDNIIIPTKTKPRKNHRFPFALKCYEAELISTPYGQSNNDQYVYGFQENDIGIPVKVHIAKKVSKFGTDMAYTNPDNWESRDIFVPNMGIRQVFHCKNLSQDRPGAMRGIPFLTPATGLIIDHNQFTEEILKTAKAQAVFAGLFKGGKGGKKMAGAPNDNQTTQTTSTFPRIDMSAGLILDIPDGYELEAFESSQPKKEFTDFQMHILSIISAITGIPRSFVLMLFGQSYSAHKGELAVFWVTVLRYRYTFVYQFLYPFWEYLLSWAVSTGNFSAPGFFDDPEIKMAWLGNPIGQFTGPKPPLLDLSKEAKGLQALKDAKIKSTRGIIEEYFTDDPDQTFAEIQQEMEAGITYDIAQQLAQSVAPEDEDDNDDNTEDGNNE